jgi:hypothetical protein
VVVVDEVDHAFVAVVLAVVEASYPLVAVVVVVAVEQHHSFVAVEVEVDLVAIVVVVVEAIEH